MFGLVPLVVIAADGALRVLHRAIESRFGALTVAECFFHSLIEFGVELVVERLVGLVENMVQLSCEG